MAGLCAPLSTLRQYPQGYLRMTRGQCGSLLLHRDGLPPSTPCRSPGALRFSPIVTVLATRRYGRNAPFPDRVHASVSPSRAARGVFHHAIALFEGDQIRPAQRRGSVLQRLVGGIRTVL